MLLCLVILHQPNKQIMSCLTLIGGISQYIQSYDLWELGNWYDYGSLLYLPTGYYKWKLTYVEGALLITRNMIG